MLEIEQIYEKYFDSIFSYVLKRVNNVETAEDITSTVFMKVLRSLKHYKAEKASVKTWIYAITGNEVINFYRKKKISLGLDKYSHLLKSADVLVEIQEKQDEFGLDTTRGRGKGLRSLGGRAFQRHRSGSQVRAMADHQSEIR